MVHVITLICYVSILPECVGERVGELPAQSTGALI